jgi:signal transduction histidine kinase
MRIRGSILFALFAFGFSAVHAAAGGNAPSIIVFITSTTDQKTDHVLLESFLSRWRERDSSASILHYPLAPTAYTLSERAKRLSIEALAARLGGRAPTLIVAQGDPAFFLSIDLRSAYFPGAPTLAFDVVGNEERRRRFASDESLYIIESSGIGEKNVEFAAKVFPKRKRAVILLFVGSELSHAEAIRASFSRAAPDLEFVFVLNPTSQEIADPYLRISPEDSFVIGFNPGWYDRSGIFLSGKPYVNSITETYGVPMFEYLRSHMDGGIVGGVGFSPEPWGRRAADLALGLVFDGIEPGHWMQGSAFVTPFADYRELVRYGSNPKTLPPGVELINEPPPAWIRYQALLQPLLYLLVAAAVYASLRAFFKRKERRLLMAANARLEREVSDRTRELRESNEELERSNENLKNAIRRTEEMQNAVLRSAREITLGRFSASMANGLNSPLGAIRSSSQAVVSIWDEGKFAESLLCLDDGQKKLFLQYAARIFDRPDYFKDAAPYELLDLERRLSRITSKDISSLALDLSDAGLSGLDDGELMVFSDERGREVARALNRLSAIIRSLWVIDEASSRAAEIVQAVRDYAIESSNEPAVGAVDLRTTIERALILFKNRLPKAVVLRTSFEDIPPVRGTEAAYVRIWAALLQNALQAMSKGGALDVRLGRDGDFAEVAVLDEGTGVDPEIEDKLFEPFVTTRHIAEGLGLGLAYCKRAIESFGGEIRFIRREKGSEFRVRVPLAV